MATCFVNWRQIFLYHRVLIVIHSHQTNFNAHRACLPMVTRWQARDSSWIAYTDDDPPVSANGICIDSFTYDDASKSLHIIICYFSVINILFLLLRPTCATIISPITSCCYPSAIAVAALSSMHRFAKVDWSGCARLGSTITLTVRD